MKTFSYFKLQLLVLIFCIFLIPHLSEAKSVIWSTNINNALYYEAPILAANGYNSTKRPIGLDNTSVNVTYQANVYNMSAGATLLSDGASIPVGTQLRFTPKPYADTDIVWFGTGYSADSPNGHWISGASAPSSISCDAQDFAGADYFTTPTGLVWRFDAYAPLSINPPTRTINHSGTATMTCDAARENCIVTGAGTINTTFNYVNTNGNFYYRFYDYRNGNILGVNYIAGCFGNNTPLALESNCRQVVARVQCDKDGDNCQNVYQTECDYSTYDLQVPAQSISYSLTAVGGNTPPTAPTITGPTTGTTNTNNQFTFTATDADNDTLRYGIDWDNNSTVDEYLPGSGYVTSGTGQSQNRAWSTAGTYTFQALAQDSASNFSVWTNHTITISATPAPTSDLKANAQDGPLTIPKNTTVTLTWSSANAVSCSKWGGTWGSGETVGTSGTETTVVTASTQYMINCGGVIDTVQINVVNQTPNPPSITYQSGTLQTGQPITFSIQGSDPDTDNIFYEVDWDNNSTVDATTLTVPSNTTQPATYTWSSAGTKTFQARTVDTAGARSNWTQHNETISATPPTAAMFVSVNGSDYTPFDVTIDPGNTIRLRWDSTNAVSCTGTNFNTSNNANGIHLSVPAPAPNTATTYSVNCGGVTDSITVTVRQLPNFTQPAITYTLSPFNTTTGFYDYIDVTFQNTNGGGSNTQANANYQFRYDAGQNGYELTRTGALGLFTVGQSVNKTERVSNVAFGLTRIEVTADNTNAVAETNEADNVRTLDLTVPPPDPGLTITADRVRVRNDETTTIRWNTTITYPGLTCQVYGPGTNLSPATLPGTVTTQPIKAKSEYTLKCTEATTGTVWSKVATVETEGVIEER